MNVDAFFSKVLYGIGREVVNKKSIHKRPSELYGATQFDSSEVRVSLGCVTKDTN